MQPFRTREESTVVSLVVRDLDHFLAPLLLPPAPAPTARAAAARRRRLAAARAEVSDPELAAGCAARARREELVAPSAIYYNH